MSRREFLITNWQSRGKPPVGEVELRRLQSALTEAFGPHTNLSPAAIARFLADEDAELRHPEIIEFDARWRETQIELEEKKLDSLADWSPEQQLRLKPAELLLKKLETLRQRFEGAGDEDGLMRIRDLAIEARRHAFVRAEDTSAEDERAENAEIAEWFGIWLQTPGLFGQWLELRKSSRDFKEKFF